VLRFKYPIEYELNPTEIDKGAQWLTLRLKNKGNVTLKRLDVELHSLDTFPLTPLFLPYGENFWWESGFTHISVSEAKAELGRLVVLSHPYTTIGKTLSAEATVKGLRKGAGLKLEFWVETPSGKFEEQAKIGIKELSAGEEARYTAEFTPKETGIYLIHAYLSDEWIRIGRKTNSIYVQKE
jgi:hypothetical protein